jgi:hypothetical protein
MIAWLAVATVCLNKTTRIQSWPFICHGDHGQHRSRWCLRGSQIGMWPPMRFESQRRRQMQRLLQPLLNACAYSARTGSSLQAHRCLRTARRRYPSSSGTRREREHGGLADQTTQLGGATTRLGRWNWKSARAKPSTWDCMP